ncbi:MAG: hypothetical protein H0V36_08240 [Chloroflexi bacterium]|nr:hypothetical protein [Chloroflexota bacterium]
MTGVQAGASGLRVESTPTGPRMVLCMPGSAVPIAESKSLALILLPDGRAIDIPIGGQRRTGGRVTIDGASDGWSAVARWIMRQDDCLFHDVSLAVTWSGPTAIEAGVRLAYRLPDAPEPGWLIPGAFYRENRPPHCPRPYPRYDPLAGPSGAGLVSDRWAFRADRAALGAVFAWARMGSLGLSADEVGPLGLGGLGLSGDGSEAWIWLDMPYREEPVRYVGLPSPADPSRKSGTWQPGQTVRLRYQVHVSGPRPEAYEPFVRALYRDRREKAALSPWMGVERAAELAAHGLKRWHFRRVERGGAVTSILAETAAFDRVAGGTDREDMHVAWVSGAPWAAALLRYGRLRGDADAVEAGEAVLDTIGAGISPSGTFWGEWRAERGWSGGWNPHGWLHARTVAEATLFMLRALRDERQAGIDHPAWERAVRSSLRFAAERQDAAGGLGHYYHPVSGDVMDREGAAGLPWIPALLLGAQLCAEPRWHEAAIRAGRFYAAFVRDGFINGAVEDVPLGPSSEDGYAAVMAFVALHAADPKGGWLDLACRAADLALTFRYAWNVPLPPESELGRYDFRTRGGDQASPCNQHLHAYGLICLPEMAALWRATTDAYYLQRSQDHLACFLQFVARHDGDFGAQRGMVSERYYQTDCFGPQGGLLPLSHAWSVGVLLHGCLAAMDEPALAAGLPGQAT